MFNRIIGVALMLLVLSACMEKELVASDDPTAVALGFWRATMNEDLQGVAKHSVNPDVPMMLSGYSSKDFTLSGEFVQQDGYYFYDTILLVRKSDKAITFPIKTVVVHREGGWKVDAWSTQQSVYSAVMERAVNSINEQLSGASSIMDISAAFEGGQMSDDLKAQLSTEMEKLEATLLQNMQKNLQ